MSTEGDTKTLDTAADVPAVPAVAAASVLPSEWLVKIQPFATTCGLSVADVTDALKSLVGDPGVEAAELLGNPEFTPNADLKARFPNVPGARLNKAIAGLRDATPAAASALPGLDAANAGASVVRGVTLLPELMDDVSLLELLRVGGVSKFGEADGVMAVRTAYTRSVGVDTIVPTLLNAMLAYAESLDTGCGPKYYEILRISKSRKYADVLEAFGGAVSSVSEKDKREFLDRVDELWPVLQAFQAHQLDAYRESDRDEGGDVRTLVQVLRQGATAIDRPDPTPVVTAARGIIDRFNRAFRGEGIKNVRALSKDRVQEAEILRDPSVLAAVGAGSFEEMIRKLELAVPADAEDTERRIAQFVLALLRLPKQSPHLLPDYILEMQKLGKPIVWPKGTDVDSRTPAGRKGRTASASDTFPGAEPVAGGRKW